MDTWILSYWAPLHCPALFHLRDATLNNILVKLSFSSVSPEVLKCVHLSYLVLKSPFRLPRTVQIETGHKSCLITHVPGVHYVAHW